MDQSRERDPVPGRGGCVHEPAAGQGGFSRRSDLSALAQGWLLTSDYWDSGVIFVRADLQSFLTKNTDRVNRELLPVVQKIQREYMRLRATP